MALVAASAQMKSIASSAYKTGNVGTMNVMLEGSDNLMERMSILEQISRSRSRDVQKYTETTQTFADRQTALKATQDRQAAELKELSDRKKKIEGDLKKLFAMRTAAFGSATETGSRYTGPIPNIAGSAGKAVTFAFNAIGVMYDYGADGPNGYDCSGLTSAAWRAARQVAAAQRRGAVQRDRQDQQVRPEGRRPGVLPQPRPRRHLCRRRPDHRRVPSGPAGEEAVDQHHDPVRLRPGHLSKVSHGERLAPPRGCRPFR
nr:hypothetical protein GCM10020092_093550 [Actinoplanes digitatis]